MSNSVCNKTLFIRKKKKTKTKPVHGGEAFVSRFRIIKKGLTYISIHHLMSTLFAK
jgi:hypothetical protein